MSKNTQPKRWQGRGSGRSGDWGWYGPLALVLHVVAGFSLSRSLSKQKTNVFFSFWPQNFRWHEKLHAAEIYRWRACSYLCVRVCVCMCGGLCLPTVALFAMGIRTTNAEGYWGTNSYCYCTEETLSSLKISMETFNKPLFIYLVCFLPLKLRLPWIENLFGSNFDLLCNYRRLRDLYTHFC